MKRALSLIMAIVTCLSCCVLFASCGHECEWSADWSKDATHHWKACTDAECAEVNEKAEHTWGAGTELEFGVTQYACTVCAQTKVDEKVTTVADDKWEEAFDFGTNFVVTVKEKYSEGADACEIIIVRDGNKLSMTETYFLDEVRSETTYLLTDGSNSFVFENVDGAWSRVPSPYTIVDEINLLETFIPEKYRVRTNYTYNEATKFYTAESITVDDYVVGFKAINLVLAFLDGKLVKCAYEHDFEGIHTGPDTFDITITYGNASVVLPTINGATVTADQWSTAMNFTNGYYTIEQDTYYEDGSMDEQDIGYYGDIIVMPGSENQVYYFVKEDNKYYMYSKMDGNYTRIEDPLSQYEAMKILFNFNTPMAYDKFTYNEDIQAYVSDSIEYEGVTMTNVVISFNNGNVESIKYNTTTMEDRSGLVIITPRAENSAPSLPQVD